MTKNDTATKEKTITKNKLKIKKPKTYRVLLHNNPSTPFQVVLDVLKKVIVALSAGELSKFGLIDTVAAPDVTVGVAVTV